MVRANHGPKTKVSPESRLIWPPLDDLGHRTPRGDMREIMVRFTGLSITWLTRRRSRRNELNGICGLQASGVDQALHVGVAELSAGELSRCLHALDGTRLQFLIRVRWHRARMGLLPSIPKSIDVGVMEEEQWIGG